MALEEGVPVPLDDGVPVALEEGVPESDSVDEGVPVGGKRTTARLV